MFKFGKKKAEQKQKKKATPAEPTVKKKAVEPTKILFEEASPLAKAKAAADKQICHVAEKGLPSFEEFGAKPREMDAEEVGEPETIKASSPAAHEEGLRPSGGKTAGRGLPSRSPSPQPPPVDLSTPHHRPLADVRPRERSPQPMAQPYRSEFSDFGYPPPANPYEQSPPIDPRYVHNPYGPPTVRSPNPSSNYQTRRRLRDEPYYPPQQGYPPDQYYDPPRPTPAPHYDQPHEPAYPPSPYYDTRPQYPSPHSERYASPMADRFSGDYGGQNQYYSEYDQPEWRPEPVSYPLSRQPRHSTTWNAPPNHPPHPTHQSPPQHYPAQYDRTPLWPGHDPHRQAAPYPSNDPYNQPGYQPHHQRARTMDSDIPYRNGWSATPSPYQPPPAPQVLPSHTSQRQQNPAPVWHEQLVRRRSYSLQPQQQRAPPPPPLADPAQEQIRRRRSQRYSDHAGQAYPYQSPAQEPQWPTPPPVQPLQPPLPHRHSVTNLAHQLTDMYIEPPSLPASRPPSQSFSPPREQPSLTKPLRDPEHFSALYKVPPASRSSSSFDFSSPSSSPSPASRTRPSSAAMNESPFDLRHSSSHTSLHSVPEAEQEEECVPESPLQREEELPTLAQFRRKRVSPPVWHDPPRQETRSEREDHSQQMTVEWNTPERAYNAVQRQRTQYRPQPPPQPEAPERKVQERMNEAMVHRQRTQSRPQPPTPQSTLPADSCAYDTAEKQRTPSRPRPPMPQATISADPGASIAAQRQRTQSRPQPPPLSETPERRTQERTDEMVHRSRTQSRPQPPTPQPDLPADSGAYDTAQKQRTLSQSQSPMPQAIMSANPSVSIAAQRQRTQSRPQPPPETPERKTQERTNEMMVYRQPTQYRPQPPTPQQVISKDSGTYDAVQRQRTKSRPQPPPLPETSERNVQEKTNEVAVHRQRTQYRPQPPTPQQATSADHSAYDMVQRQRTKSRPQPPPADVVMSTDEVPYEVPSASDEDDYGYTNDEYCESTAHNSPATNRVVTSSPLKDGRSPSSVPSTPNRQRTVAVRGPRAPKSPPNASPYSNM